MATGYVKVSLPSVDSTQDEAFARFAGTPVAVVAGRQVSGRGRSGAVWAQPDRAIFVSLAFALPSDWSALSLLGGIAAIGALGDSGTLVRLKWPNDLLIDDRKVGGLLTEVRGDVVAVGWGCNLWWPDPPVGAGAVFVDDPGAEYVQDTAMRWSEMLLTMATDGFDEEARARYSKLCSTIGRMITWQPDGGGLAEGVDADGGLVVVTDAGKEVLRSGAVRHVRTATMRQRDTEAK